MKLGSRSGMLPLARIIHEVGRLDVKNHLNLLFSMDIFESDSAGLDRSVPIFAKVETRRRGNAFPLVRRRNEEIREKRRAVRPAFMNNAG